MWQTLVWSSMWRRAMMMGCTSAAWPAALSCGRSSWMQAQALLPRWAVHDTAAAHFSCFDLTRTGLASNIYCSVTIEHMLPTAIAFCGVIQWTTTDSARSGANVQLYITAATACHSCIGSFMLQGMCCALTAGSFII